MQASPNLIENQIVAVLIPAFGLAPTGMTFVLNLMTLNYAYLMTQLIKYPPEGFVRYKDRYRSS